MAVQTAVGHLVVSSRAPVWGASLQLYGVRAVRVSFKSCPRVGGIRFLLIIYPALKSFKSCPRVGGIRRGAIRKSL